MLQCDLLSGPSSFPVFELQQSNGGELLPGLPCASSPRAPTSDIGGSGDSGVAALAFALLLQTLNGWAASRGWLGREN